MSIRYRVFALSLALTPALAACPSTSSQPVADSGPADAPLDAPPACGTGFIGDPSKPGELEIHALTADAKDVPLNDKGDLSILFPPQGGRVVFVGARARNIDSCAVQLTGSLRDPTSKQVMLDSRTVNLTPGADGWGTTSSAGDLTPTFAVDAGGVRGETEGGVGGEARGGVLDGNSAQLASYSNVPVCPNQWSGMDLFDREYELTVTMQDHAGHMATKTIHVTPRCNEVGRVAECLCLCKFGYKLGESCARDGGTDAAIGNAESHE